MSRRVRSRRTTSGRRRLLHGIVACGAAAMAAACAPTTEGPADLVLLNGHVITLDESGTIADAVAIVGDRVAFVGTNEEVREWMGPETRALDLEGNTVTPGLLDAHAHFSGGAVDRLFVLDLSYPGVQSVADIVEAVRERVELAEPGDWILGRGWDEGKLEELRYVLASDLDAVAPENPVWLTHTMGHYGTANSLALRMAGIDATRDDPPAGTIDKGAGGEPTGVLKESAQGLVRSMVPGYTPSSSERGSPPWPGPSTRSA